MSLIHCQTDRRYFLCLYEIRLLPSNTHCIPSHWNGSSGITSNLIFIWLQTICLNFIMAYPLQILVVGPFCRFIFRHLFASTNQGKESKVENEMEQHGFAE